MRAYLDLCYMLVMRVVCGYSFSREHTCVRTSYLSHSYDMSTLFPPLSPGLDNAGKTTLLYRLKSGAVSAFVPTQRANVEEIVCAPTFSTPYTASSH